MGGDAEARTRTVRRIHGIPHEGEDSTGAELAGKAYREGLVELVTFVVAFGCAILLVLYCYRAALCFGARCGWRGGGGRASTAPRSARAPTGCSSPSPSWASSRRRSPGPSGRRSCCGA
ncbi:hypothetical protein JL721_6295 [Aureococcus anophagefferens]|nr:hypothetical protein JL721_6295 [Aureococcus anophagefferens]